MGLLSVSVGNNIMSVMERDKKSVEVLRLMLTLILLMMVTYVANLHVPRWLARHCRLPGSAARTNGTYSFFSSVHGSHTMDE